MVGSTGGVGLDLPLERARGMPVRINLLPPQRCYMYTTAEGHGRVLVEQRNMPPGNFTTGTMPMTQ